MASHIARVGAIIVTILVCLFLPYLPGGYDHFAVTLSTMAQMSGFAGPLLIPFGLVWLLVESRQRDGRGFWFAMAALVAATLVVAILALGAFITQGVSLALVVFALWAFGIARMAPTLRVLRTTGLGRFNAAPLYLVVIPLVVSLAQYLFLGAATDYSRHYAISQSAALINDIENYHKANGRYPASLLALHQDYKTGVIGVERYFYEPHGDAYNLVFEQISNQLGVRELVVYNPRGEHFVISHDSDRLLWTAEQQRARRTYNVVFDASAPHWKYYWFD